MAIAAALAGAIGYAAGLLLHYALSVRFVFDAAATAKGPTQLLGEFALSGLAGLGITISVIWLATDVAGASPLVAKIPAAVTSFLGVFALRRMVVFARG
jgi:putative flippase GtrA